jgi:hypothetical protein
VARFRSAITSIPPMHARALARSARLSHLTLIALLGRDCMQQKVSFFPSKSYHRMLCVACAACRLPRQENEHSLSLQPDISNYKPAVKIRPRIFTLQIETWCLKTPPRTESTLCCRPRLPRQMQSNDRLAHSRHAQEDRPGLRHASEEACSHTTPSPNSVWAFG